MEQDWFKEKIICEFAVITYDINPNVVTQHLTVEPTRIHSKGDAIPSRFSSEDGIRPHGIWAIRESSEVCPEVDTSEYIKRFKDLLSDKLDAIQQLKTEHHFECVFSISFYTEDAGVTIELNAQEMEFITAISSRFSCAVIAVESLT